MREETIIYKVWVESLNGVQGWAFGYPVSVMHAAACVSDTPSAMKEWQADHMASEFRSLGYRAEVFPMEHDTIPF